MTDVVKLPIERQRVGYTVDHRTFQQAVFGHVPPEIMERWQGSDSVAGVAIAAHLQLADQIARRMHEQNEAVKEAKTRNLDPAAVLPDVAARKHNLALAEREVEQIAVNVKRMHAKHVAETATTHPF